MSWTNRGKGFCPKCHTAYSNRWKPEMCACGQHLGGTAPVKLPKPSCPNAVEINNGLYSIKSSTRDDRCFVLRDGSLWACLYAACKDSRAVFVYSGRAQEFTCPHIKHVTSSVGVQHVYPITPEKIVAYPCDNETKEHLRTLEIPAGFQAQAVYQVTDRNYVSFGPPTATNTIGFCHIKLETGRTTNYKCQCKGFVSKGKQEKTRGICIHLHVLFCALELSSNGESKSAPSSIPTTSTGSCDVSSSVPPVVPSSTNCDSLPLSNLEPALSTTTPNPSRASTMELYSSLKLPYNFAPELLMLVCTKDIQTHTGSPDGWPSSFEVPDSGCGLCGFPLGVPKSHPGTRGGSILYTNLNAFKEIDIKVRHCSNASCQAMHRVVPTKDGLFNVCDKILISFDILLEWRELFKRGCPVSNFILAKSEQLTLKLKEELRPSDEKLHYLNSLLYNAFWAFEMCTERDLSSVVCGVCGIIGEVYYGDGNEKNCCSNKQIAYPKKGSSVKQLHSLEKFLDQRCAEFLEKVIYTSTESEHVFQSEEIPPVIAPILLGPTVYNTEQEKKSIYLKNETAGDPASLHKKIKDSNLNMDTLMDTYSLVELKELASECEIAVAGKSKTKLCADIYSLYSSMLVGLCPCHGYSKVHGHTGGFYHLVCRHGCTVASKFLTLTESVRDAADLYLSLKYQPVVFICDSPCGFVRHLECRNPELCQELWGENSGCFEKPEYAKKPTKGQDFPMLVPCEYRSTSSLTNTADLGSYGHPLTGSSRRFALGDRFHNSVNPHKSPLCLFHDIDLCAQSNAIKTSYQEAENFRKNLKRLRSSTLQGFGVHFCYNYLMDFYQNEAIVKKQKNKLAKYLKEGQQLIRDKFHRLTIVNVSCTAT